jgi:hypothetical protein
MQWQAPLIAGKSQAESQLELGKQLKDQYGIRSKQYMQSCSTCHR